jgi:tRNA (mo5U34)-methyltransferase
MKHPKITSLGVRVDAENQNVTDEYLIQLRDFNNRIAEMGRHEVAGYCWYHTIDLGDGLITPGAYDFRSSVSAFGFPENMKGLTVLDVGSATGFFTFEFERRGANVTSAELPSMSDLDRFPGQTIEQSLAKMRRMLSEQIALAAAGEGATLSDQQIFQLLLEGPFQFCKEMLNSKVRRCYSAIYDLTPDIAGRESFDFVFIGDVLLHTINPVNALATAAKFCHGTLVLAQLMPETDDKGPAMLYVGGDQQEDDNVSWWLPNKTCLIQVLRKLGFSSVTEHGKHHVVMRQNGRAFDQTILHASR